MNKNSTTTLYFYQGDYLNSELQGPNSHVIFRADGQALAQRVCDETQKSLGLLSTDNNDSVLQILSQQGVQPIVYIPFGYSPVENAKVALLGFNGELRDSVAGYYLLGNGYRAFNPGLMRFQSPDSLSPFDYGGLNSYAYCLGDPINLTDPSGHVPLGALLKKWQPHQNLNAISGTSKAITKHKNIPKLKPVATIKPSVRPQDQTTSLTVTTGQLSGNNLNPPQRQNLTTTSATTTTSQAPVINTPQENIRMAEIVMRHLSDIEYRTTLNPQTSPTLLQRLTSNSAILSHNIGSISHQRFTVELNNFTSELIDQLLTSSSLTRRAP